MKKLLDKVDWRYKDGQFHAEGWKDNKFFGLICFEADLDPISGEGKVGFSSLTYPSLNKEVKTSGGMPEIERVLDGYYEWARSLWDVLPQDEIHRAWVTACAIKNQAITKHIRENGGFSYGQN